MSARNNAKSGLTDKKRQAALALASGDTRSSAAKAAKVTRGTIDTWVRDAAFIAELDRLREDIRVEALDRIASSYGKAANALIEIVEDRGHRDRYKAALWLLERMDTDDIGDVWVKAEAIWGAEVVEQLRGAAG